MADNDMKTIVDETNLIISTYVTKARMLLNPYRPVSATNMGSSVNDILSILKEIVSVSHFSFKILNIAEKHICRSKIESTRLFLSSTSVTKVLMKQLPKPWRLCK